MTHLLVTNDFPPKIGGIQSYLYELWRRQPQGSFGVLTIAHELADVFDATQDYPIRRLPVDMLRPTRRILAEIDQFASEIGATRVVLDPVLPVGLLGPRLKMPYALVAHGAEVVIPGRLPVARQLMRRAITRAELIIAAGSYPATAVRAIGGGRSPRIVTVPPGVDLARFRPLSTGDREASREYFGFARDSLLVVSVSRLVPRKGMDVLIEASARLADRYPELEVVIGGTGRDEARLRRLVAKHHAPVRLFGRVEERDLPALYGCADIAAMFCRNRWFGLEQEGFGIVFLEASATATAAIAGRSGGAGEAVIDRETGLVVDHPARVESAVDALDELLGDRATRLRFGLAGRSRLEEDADYDVLATRLREALLAFESSD